MTTGVTSAVESLRRLLETPILSIALNVEASELLDLYVRRWSQERHPTKPSNDMEFLQTVLSQDPTTGVSDET